MVARVIGFGESEHSRVIQKWQELFRHLSVGPEDDIWARFLNKELTAWRTEDLRGEWRSPVGVGPWPAIDLWHQASTAIPAQQFVRDLDHTLLLKQRLTRRQWISLVESILRLGTASHILWLCRAGIVFNSAVNSVLEGDVPPSEAELKKRFEIGDPFWRYSQVAGLSMKQSARGFVMSRLSLNLLLWHCQLEDVEMNVIKQGSFSSIRSMAEFLSSLAKARPRLRIDGYRDYLRKAIDDNPRAIAGKEGIGSNIGEFLRHVLGQRQTSESGMESYDQGYFLRKRGNYKTAPWIVSLGPVSVLTLVHCCTNLARGPRTVEDFCRHLSKYGIEMRAQDVASSDLGQTLRNLGLVLDSPDAEGGMVLVSPFQTSTSGARL